MYFSELWCTLMYFDGLQQCTTVDYSVLRWTIMYFDGQ